MAARKHAPTPSPRTALVAGPVRPSAKLEALFRLRRALLKHFPDYRHELSPRAHDASLVFLERIETEGRCTLPSDIIVLATLRIPAFLRATGLTLSGLGSPERDCAGDFHPPRGWIAVASFDDAGMGSTPIHELSCGSLLAVSRNAEREGDPMVRVLDGPGPSTAENLSTFVFARLKLRYANKLGWEQVRTDAGLDETNDEECIVRIIDDRPAPPGPPKRVVHAKFGKGTVLRELEGKKFEIAFESGPSKILQTDFVTVLASEE